MSFPCLGGRRREFEHRLAASVALEVRLHDLDEGGTFFSYTGILTNVSAAGANVTLDTVFSNGTPAGTTGFFCPSVGAPQTVCDGTVNIGQVPRSGGTVTVTR